MHAEESVVPQNGTDKIVNNSWGADVVVVDAALILRLAAQCVESWINWAGARGLQAAIVIEAGENLLVIADVVIAADGVELFGIELSIVGTKRDGSRCIHPEDSASSSRRSSERSGSAAEVVFCHPATDRFRL